MSGVVRNTDVLIVGAGPTGLVMALCLAKCGVRSIVVERQRDVNPHPKAHELNTRSIEILASLGVSIKELFAEASPKSDGCRIAFCTTINEEFGSIDLLKDIDDPAKYRRNLESDEPYLNISQTEVERVIRRHVEAQPEIELRLGHEWQSLTQTSENTTSLIRDRASDTVLEIHASWVIAADGAGSRVRQSLGIEMLGPDKIQDFKNAYFELNLRDHIERPAKLYWITDPDAFGTFIAHHIEKRWVYNVPIYEPWETPEDYTDDVLAERIKIALGLPDVDVEIKSTSVWRMTVQTAEQWRDGRVFLVGDAAHRFPPTGGLGMNSGIADVHNLAWKIAETLQSTANEDLLDTYEVERRPVAERNANESFENFEKIFDIFEALGLPRDGAEKAARLRASLLLRILPKGLQRSLFKLINGILKSRIRNTIRNPRKREVLDQTVRDQIPHFDRIGLDLGYVYKGPAVIDNGSGARPAEVTAYQPSCQPGARFPHIWLSPETSTVSSHTLLNYGQWTLLNYGEKRLEIESGEPAMSASKIKCIQIAELEIPAAGKHALINLCNIEPDGALLIRPDGHVAMQHKPGTSLSLMAQMQKLGLNAAEVMTNSPVQ